MGGDGLRHEMAALQRYHDQVYPLVCGCFTGCEQEASGLVAGGWRWIEEEQGVSHAYEATPLVEADVHRDTLRAAFWLELLDSAGVRTAEDLALLESWMVLKSSSDAAAAVIARMADRAADIESGVSAREMPAAEMHFRQHQDVYSTFNTPINIAKLLRCLAGSGGGLDVAAAVEEETYEERGFKLVEVN